MLDLGLDDWIDIHDIMLRLCLIQTSKIGGSRWPSGSFLALCTTELGSIPGPGIVHAFGF